MGDVLVAGKWQEFRSRVDAVMGKRRREYL